MKSKDLPVHLKKSALTLGKFLFVVAFWLFVWYLVSSRMGSDLIFPSPRAVFRELGLLVTNQSESLVRYGTQMNFWLITAISLLRILWGVLISLVLGTLLAYLTSISRILNMLLSPMLSAIKATPVASFIILAMLWFEKTNLPVFITALIVIPIVWANVSEGIRSVDPKLKQVTELYRFSLPKKLFRFYIPSIAPYFLAACQSSLGMAWKAGVAAEILAVPAYAIGSEIFFSKQYLYSETLFAWSLIVIILSLIMEKAFLYSLRRIGKRFHLIAKEERHAEI